jgi:hypothetical protein
VTTISKPALCAEETLDDSLRGITAPKISLKNFRNSSIREKGVCRTFVQSFSLTSRFLKKAPAIIDQKIFVLK